MIHHPIWKQVQPHQLLGLSKAEPLLALIRRTEGVAGDAAEVGVYHGGTAVLLAHAMPTRTVYGYDTFAGVPEAGPLDRHRVGEFADCSLAEVQALADRCGVRNLQLRAGVFPESLSADPYYPLAFVHLDVDQYQSTTAALWCCWPRLSPGGILVLDDYHWPWCPGVDQALREFACFHPSVAVQEVPGSPHQAYLVRGDA